jgi:hypothetical protein
MNLSATEGLVQQTSQEMAKMCKINILLSQEFFRSRKSATT